LSTEFLYAFSSCDFSLEKQLDKIFGGETLRLLITSTFSSLPDVDKIMDLGRIHIPSAIDTGKFVVCGIRNYFCYFSL